MPVKWCKVRCHCCAVAVHIFRSSTNLVFCHFFVCQCSGKGNLREGEASVCLTPGYHQKYFTMTETNTLQQTPVSPNQALWEKGDFTRIAETMRTSGTELIEKIGITPGIDVLDLGCGDGTTALPSARLGARVTAIDIARNLLDAGTQRAQSEKLDNITFQHGDAANLEGVPDKSFDVVVSIFGAMFCPKPFEVAKELVRVTRKGGHIVMGNWIPGDPTLVAQILRIATNYTPPPPEGFVSPMLWGVESNVVERFGAAGISPENISFEKDTYTFTADFSPTEFLNRFRLFYGPTMNAFEAAEKNGKSEELYEELHNLFVAENRSSDPEKLSIPATYLRVTVTR